MGPEIPRKVLSLDQLRGEEPSLLGQGAGQAEQGNAALPGLEVGHGGELGQVAPWCQQQPPGRGGRRGQQQVSPQAQCLLGAGGCTDVARHGPSLRPARAHAIFQSG